MTHMHDGWKRRDLLHVTLMFAAFRSVPHHSPKICTNISRRNLATRVGLLDELSSRGFVSQVTKCDRLVSYDIAYQWSLGLNNSGTFFGTRTAWFILA